MVSKDRTSLMLLRNHKLFVVWDSNDIAPNFIQLMVTLKMAGRNFLPRCTAFFNWIPVESLRALN